MAEKQPIVIKKVYEETGRHHGGAWKVAFADFMTAMMAFFLVMWLLAQSDEVKAQVASYFTGPSMLEHQFTSYGAELTLEKIFLDLFNEPLKVAQDFMQPADFTPNVMAMGSKKIVMHHVATELGHIAKNVSVQSDKLVFEIPDKYLFKSGTVDPSGQFVDIMTKVEAITMGLEYSTVDIETLVYMESVAKQNPVIANKVANARLDLLKNKVSSTLEHDSVDVAGKAIIKKRTYVNSDTILETGTVKFTIQQKRELPDGKKPRPLEGELGNENGSLSVYDDFVQKVVNKNKNK